MMTSIILALALSSVANAAAVFSSGPHNSGAGVVRMPMQRIENNQTHTPLGGKREVTVTLANVGISYLVQRMTGPISPLFG